MLSMVLTWLGGLLGGPFAKAAVDAYKAKLDAGNNADKIAADLAVQQATLDTQREALEQATLTAEEGRWGPWIRWGFAIPFVLYVNKVVLYDQVFKLGVTDHLSPEMLAILQIVIAAYFGHSAIAIAARALSKR